MKKILLFFFLISSATVLLFASFKKQPSHEVVQTPEVLGVPTASQIITYNLNYDNQSYDASVLAAKGVITLHSNLENRKPAYELVIEQTCSSLVNAGFYTKEQTHTALFISDYEEIQKEKSSLLFDSFLTINDFETARITRDVPKDRLRLALQSGPMLKENAETIELSIRNDKNARRMVAATDGNNIVYFIAFYKADSVFSGPLLSDLPYIIEELENVSELRFADALNLDGGTASAMYSGEFNLPEASYIGGYFCIH